MAGAYKYQKAPKYRKATKIPESTYKYQKAMENIGKMSVIALCMDYKLLFLCAWIMIDAHKCSTQVRVWFVCLQISGRRSCFPQVLVLADCGAGVGQ